MSKKGQGSITVSRELWERLDKYRAKHGLRSIPVAIIHALEELEQSDKLKAKAHA